MPSGSIGRVRSLLGNLDIEAELAAWDARLQGRSSPRATPQRIVETLAAFSTLLRVFAREGDLLGTLTAIDPARLTHAGGLVVPRLTVVKRPAEIVAGAVLAWSRVAWTGRSPAQRPQTTNAAPADPFDFLWNTPAIPPQAALAANHRSFCLGMRAELGVTLPGEGQADSLTALEGLLREHVRGDARWVAKAPLSAAGRARVHGRGVLPSTAALGGVAAILAEQGSVVFEPWMERELDVGCAGYVDASDVRVLGLHRLIVDGGGRFRAVIAGETSQAGLTRAEEATLRAALAHVGRRLASRGFRGPLGIDAWRYREAGGTTRFQPLGEINARLTFGHLAHAYRAHFIERGEIEHEDDLALHLRAVAGSSPPETSNARRVWPLLLPARRGQSVGTAWLESASSGAS